MNDDIARWQTRLEDGFAGPKGIVGERAVELNNAEQRHELVLVGTFRGFVRLMDSFFDFYIQTLIEGHALDDPPHTLYSATCYATFRRFRAAYLIFWRGYPDEASALLRAVWENVLYLGAAMHKVIRLEDLLDSKTDPSGVSREQFKKAVRGQRRALEKKIREDFLRRGFQKHIKTLENALSTLHFHVHRGESTIIDTTLRHLRSQPVPVFPEADSRRASSFCNVGMFLGWCMSRLLAGLNNPAKLSAGWTNRYLLLDESFKGAIASFASTELKDMGVAFQEFISQKLSFPWQPKTGSGP
jgi:hypothetical protein